LLNLHEAKDFSLGALRICSLYDIKAGRSAKYSQIWTSYKVHLSESCDADLPRFITTVETTEATNQDQLTASKIHASFMRKGLLPGRHIVDQV